MDFLALGCLSTPALSAEMRSPDACKAIYRLSFVKVDSPPRWYDKYLPPFIVAVKDRDGNLVEEDDHAEISLGVFQFAGGASATLAGNAKKPTEGGYAFFSRLRFVETGLREVALRASSSNPCVMDEVSYVFPGNQN